MRRVFVVALIVLVAVATGCGDKHDYTQVVDEPAPLITGFQSYSRSASVRMSMRGKYGWNIIRAENLPANDKRPPFGTLSVSVEGFSHLGESGELQISFFNDRLEGTWFYPDDATAYLEKLNASGIAVGDTDSLLVSEASETPKMRTVPAPPHGLVVIATDYRGKLYVAWVDKRLQAERSRWIEKHS